MLFFFEYIWMHCEYTSEIIAKEIINILQIGLLFFFFPLQNQNITTFWNELVLWSPIFYYLSQVT